MAAKTSDHPYAAEHGENSSDNSTENTAFKDSPRKVLVQQNTGAAFGTLNDISLIQDFSCFTAVRNDLTANGFHVDSDDMETVENCESEAGAEKGNHDTNKNNAGNAQTGDLCMSGKSDMSETDSSKVLDIFLGIKNVFSGEAETGEESNTAENKHEEDDRSSELYRAADSEKNEKQNIGDENKTDQDNNVNMADNEEMEPRDSNTDPEEQTQQIKTNNEQNEENINDSLEDKETNLNDTKDDNEDTDEADITEDSMDQSLETASEFTSEIKSGVGNGIIMAVKKKAGRPKKRKNSALWTRPSPYKIRRLSSGSPQKASAEEGSEGDTLAAKTDEEGESGMRDMETNTPDEENENSTERLRSRRSRTPGSQDGFIVGDEAISEEVQKLESPSRRGRGGFAHRRGLLFNKGRRASPSQIKPLGPEEMERYTAPFKHGWKRELVYRGVSSESATKTQADTYYFPPSGPKLRSMVQINDWLSTHDTTLTADNFTFMRRAIGVEGEIVRNASQGRGVTAARKRQEKRLNDSEDIHDDNDGQYDKPEIVIERDSDEFLTPIISAASSESSTKPVVSPAEPRRGRPPKKKEFSNIPNLIELKNEKVEMMQPSNEQVIVSPSKKKEHKATARKSTTQKTFKKPIPFSGVENLCSLKCPGMEGIPPMLHCNVCMCLFHNECVNFYGPDGDFICLRCKDMQPLGGSGPTAIMADGNIMKVSSPKPLNQLNQLSSSSPNIVRVMPHSSGEMKILVPSGSPLPVSLMKAATPPLFKMVQVSNGPSAMPASSMHSPIASVGTPSLSYPLFMTPNSATVNASVASLFPKTSTPAAPVTSTPVSSKSQNLLDMVKDKIANDYPQIRPLIKQEPVDTSYDAAEKSTKDDGKNVKASTEALDNLKTVLSSRLGSLQAERTDSNKDMKPFMNSPRSVLPQSHSTLVKLINTIPQPVGSVSNTSSVSRTSHFAVIPPQPRMSHSFNPLPMQFGPNLVPIGPPIPLNRFSGRMPLAANFNATSGPGTSRPGPAGNQNLLKQSSVIVTTQDEIGISSGPLVVNAKSVTPMNGQLLTLPPPVAKKLTLNKPLALKINNRQITVPPSGFFQSSEGLKVFLPPNTFPTADENVMDVSVTNEKSQEESGPSVAKPSPSGSQSSAHSDLGSNKSGQKITVTDIEQVKEPGSTKTADIRNNKYYRKCCLIQRLYGYDYMLHIFKYLSIQDLLRASLVCKTWKRITVLPELWRTVNFHEVKVLDWEKALKYVSKRDVQSISLIGVSHFDEPNRTWHQLVSSLQELSMLKKIAFDLVPAAVLQSVAGKLPKLESFCAEKISDFTDKSMWEIPAKLDVGNFKCATELRELKLCGTGGLSLPSFSFGCGLADLGKLPKLHTLHLTSLKNVNSSDFNFISSLTSVRDLAVGDCTSWTQETYNHLQKLTSLQKLRLEKGGEIPDPGLGLALSHLTELESLELCKFTIAYTFDNHVSSLKKLRHLTVYPNSSHYTGEVNTNTLKAVQHLKQLKTLVWIIPHASTSSIILDNTDSTGTDELSEQTHQWIPFQALQVSQMEDKGRSAGMEYISVQQLKGKLKASLPETDVVIKSAKPERQL